MKKAYDPYNKKDPFINLFDIKSRNKRRIVLDAKDKSSTFFTIATKNDFINSNLDRRTFEFLNETIKLDEGNITERKKKNHVTKFEIMKKKFFENYYSRTTNKDNGKEKLEIRIKSPKDNKNSPFKRKSELLKRLNIENQIIKENIMKESKYPFVFINLEREKAYLLNSNENLKIMNTTLFNFDQKKIIKKESSTFFKTNMIEDKDFQRENSLNLLYNSQNSHSNYQRIDEEAISKERYYSKLRIIRENNYYKNSLYSEIELNNANTNNKEKSINPFANGNQHLPMGLYYGKNSNEFLKYTVFDKDNEMVYSNKNKKDTKNQNNLSELKKTNNTKITKQVMTKNPIFSSLIMESMQETKEFKRKIVDNFIDSIKLEKFRSDLFRHRRIFVILNGTVVLNVNTVSGKFTDIPTKKFFLGLSSKKERILFFHKFIEKCIDIFGLSGKIRNVYMANGEPIFDLMEIPEEDKYVYVSLNDIFIGINIMNYSKQVKEVISNMNLDNEIEGNDSLSHNYINKNRKIVVKDYYKNYAKENEEKITSKKMKNKLNFHKKIRRLNSIINLDFEKMEKQRNHSFDIGFFERKNQEYELKKDIFYKIRYGDNFDKNLDDHYFSETDNKKNNAWEYIKCNFTDSLKLFLYYFDFISSKNWLFLKKRVAQKIKNLSNNQRFDKELDKDLIGNVDLFNENIRKKIYSLNNFMEKKKRVKNNKKEESMKKDTPGEITRKFKETMQSQTVKLMKRFLMNLNLFKNKDRNYNDYFINQESERYKNLPHVQKNIDKSKNVYYFMDKYVNSVLPTLFDLNIPRLLEKYKNFTREELYELYTQYKVLMKICIATNKNPLVVKKGIDFKSFHKGVLQMSNESETLAQKIFSTINESNTKYLSLDEFLKGMSIIKSENITNKIDMFFKIIDTDGNGMLSWDEVFDISIMSLKRSLVTDDESSEKLVENLARYFADLIFNMVDIDIDGEIPLPKIKEKIFEGGEEGTYLEMFCCADNFKKSADLN